MRSERRGDELAQPIMSLRHVPCSVEGFLFFYTFFFHLFNRRCLLYQLRICPASALPVQKLGPLGKLLKCVFLAEPNEVKRASAAGPYITWCSGPFHSCLKSCPAHRGGGVLGKPIQTRAGGGGIQVVDERVTVFSACSAGKREVF